MSFDVTTTILVRAWQDSGHCSRCPYRIYEPNFGWECAAVKVSHCPGAPEQAAGLIPEKFPPEEQEFLSTMNHEDDLFLPAYAKTFGYSLPTAERQAGAWKLLKSLKEQS